MTSFYANLSNPAPNPAPAQMNVVFVVYPNIVLLDLVGPLQVFTHARKDGQSAPAYQTHVVSGEGGRISTNTILPIDSDPLSEWNEKTPADPIHTLRPVDNQDSLKV